MRNNALTACLMLLTAALPLKAQKLAASLNGLWLATGIVNAGAEMTVGRSTTLGLSFIGIRYPWAFDEMTGIGIQPELRHYFSGRPMYHHFIGVAALSGTYDLTFNDSKYTGTAAGIGLTFGYVVPIGRRLNIDLHSGFGIIHVQDRNRGHDNLTLPTKAGVSITYILR